MHRSLVALATVVACLIVAPSAFAWGGGSIDQVSCPEIHYTAPVENGPWVVKAAYGTATTAAQFNALTPVVYNKQVDGFTGPSVTGGFYLPDNAGHVVTVAIGNAANIADGFKAKTVHMSWCANVAGPPGPKGDPGVGYDCTGTAVPTGGTPAMCPGTNGSNGKDNNSATSKTTTIIIHEAPKVCTSKRHYAFKVRRYYPSSDGNTKGQIVVGATATEEGIRDVKVTKTKTGRFVVTWSTVGKKFVAGGTVKTMTVRASLAVRVPNGTTKTGKPRFKYAVNPKGPKHINLVWKYRPCTSGHAGDLNAPSAAGQGATGGA